MENQINETIEQQDKENPSLQTNRVFTDAYALQIADQVLTNIERVQLKTAHKSYDVKKIGALLADYKAGRSNESGDELQTEFRVLQELHFWRLMLARRDEAVKAYHLRRFYDENTSSVNAQVLAALGCFYRSLMPSFEVRSKYDYIVTQLFSAKLPDKPRYVRVGATELIERLQRFNIIWTGIEIDWADEKMRHAREEAIAVFEVLRAEVAAFNSLEELLKSNFFNRVRRHKQYLGETFFVPEITAASIQCNVAVGNKFSQLILKENETFRQALDLEHGGVDVLNLVLEENPDHSSVLLKQINPEQFRTVEDSEFEINQEPISVINNSAEIAENHQPEFDNPKPAEFENLEKTDDCFENVVEQAKFSDENQNSEPMPGTDDMAGGENESQEFSREKIEVQRDGSVDFLMVLDEINKREPVENLLREYLNSSVLPIVRNFDLANYLNDIDEAEQSEIDLKWRALRLIFVAEDYQRRLSRDSKSVPVEEEIKSLKNEIQAVINELRAVGGKLHGEHRKERANVLLTAVNDLLQARSRLILVPPTSPKSQKETTRHQTPVAEKTKINQNSFETTVKPKAFEAKRSEPRQINLGLVALTLLIVLAGLGYFFYPTENISSDTVKVEIAGVKDVNLSSLRGGEKLVVARISNNTLIGVVGENWKNEVIEDKRAALQSFLGQGTELQFRTVLLFDSKGEIVGNAAGTEITAK